MTPQQLAWRAAHATPWYERIGDSGAAGWLTAAATLGAAALCFRAARGTAKEKTDERRLWLGIALTLGLVGINKQLDLQVALIDIWRELALAQGWYGNRRLIQMLAFVAGLIGGLALLAWILPRLRRAGPALRWAAAGLALVGLYIVLRAAKFQHILWDDPRQTAVPIWLILIEPAGVAIVAAAALARSRSARRPRTALS